MSSKMKRLETFLKRKVTMRLVWDADKCEYVLPQIPEKAYIIMPSGHLLPKGMENHIQLQSFLYYDNNDVVYGEPYINVFNM